MTVIPLLLVLLQAAAAAPNGSAAKVHVCRFEPSDGAWKGSCGQMDEENPALIIHSSKAIMTGRWRKDAEPSSTWAGEMKWSDGVVPIEIEVYSDGEGVLRSQDDGWFPIDKSTISSSALQFEIDFGREVPASNLDREIINRAAAILSSEAMWNRADTRECSPSGAKWSIYCAMEKATVEVTGGFHHRRPALQVVRKIVAERSARRPYKHRLMDYNNDPATRFTDVQTLFAEALRRIE